MAKACLLIVGLLLTWALAGILVGLERVRRPAPAGMPALFAPEEDRRPLIEDAGVAPSPYYPRFVYDEDLPLTRVPASSPPPPSERLTWSDIIRVQPEDRLLPQPGWEWRTTQDASSSFYEYDRLPLGVVSSP